MNANSENHQPTSVDDLADRLMDRALAEAIGGETPPDLSELILAGKRPSTHIAADTISRRHLSRRAWLTLAVAAMLLIAAVPLIWPALSGTQRNLTSFNAPPGTPSPYYLTDGVQHYAPGPEFKIAREATPAESGRLAAPGPGVVGPGPGQISSALPPPADSPSRYRSDGQTVPAPLTPGARSTLEALGAEGLLGPVDIRFVEGANTVIIHGRDEDVQLTMDRIKAIEGASGTGGAEYGAATASAPGLGRGVLPDSKGNNSDFDSLIDTIQSTVDSDAWGEKGERGDVRPFEPNLSLVISQSQSVQDETAAPGLPRFTSDLAVPYRQNSFELAGKPLTAEVLSERTKDSVESAARPTLLSALEGNGQSAPPEASFRSSDRLFAFDDSRSMDVKKMEEAGGRMLLADGHERQPLGEVAFGIDALITFGTDGNDAGRDLRPEKTTDLGTGPGLSGDQYVRIVENPFIKAEGPAAVSTFSIDVDTASYTNVRRFLMTENTLPPPDAVRIEELVNYFKYDYAPPVSPNDPVAYNTAMANQRAEAEAKGFPPFAAHIEVAGCPWQPEHRLVRIGVKGAEMDRRERPKSNLVFLVDVSGSMNEPNKLPLVIDGLQDLARELGENDRVAIVVYAQQEGLVLPSTPGNEQAAILGALSQLRAGGSTAGGAGIQLAYQIAQDHFIEGGTNRVILCTDGDFNVGTTSTAELERLVEQKAKDTKVFLSVLGFGRGNLNDQMMEAISNRGNGNYSYVDNLREARRVFVEEMSGTLVTIAKDVKIQVEFNPKQVAGYRLLGYENRMLRTEDFNDDKKDAGEIGAGHTVTALYEIVPAGKPVDLPPVDDLKYQQTAQPAAASAAAADGAADDISRELLTLKMKYKKPEAETSEDTLEWPVTDGGQAFSAASGDFQFASAVAGFGMLLRGSEYKGNLTYAAALELAQGGLGADAQGYRGELLDMIRRAKQLRGE